MNFPTQVNKTWFTSCAYRFCIISLLLDFTAETLTVLAFTLPWLLLPSQHLMWERACWHLLGCWLQAWVLPVKFSGTDEPTWVKLEQFPPTDPDFTWEFPNKKAVPIYWHRTVNQCYVIALLLSPLMLLTSFPWCCFSIKSLVEDKSCFSEIKY